MKKSNTYDNIKYLWKYLGKNRKAQFILLAFLMLLSVFTEIVSIGSIIPFLSVLTHPEKVMELEWVQPILNFLNIHSESELLFPTTVGFVMAIVLSTLIRILLLWVNSQLAASMGVDLKKEVYKRTLYQPYEFHIAHNSSELISTVTEKVGIAIHAGIMHVLMLVSAFLTSLAIIMTLLAVNALVAIITFVLLGGGYLFIGYMVKKYIRKNGEIIAKNQPLAVKCMQEGLGGIRDIILDNSQNVFIDIYSKVAFNSQYAGMRNGLFGSLPKLFLEMLGMVLIAILAYFLATHGAEKEAVLPILGVLSLGAQKLLPALQQIYFSWSLINGSSSMIENVVEQLKKPLPRLLTSEIQKGILDFQKFIILKDVSFKYKGTEEFVLKDLNLKIKKGSKVGFVGTTGSGKSTLLDIIMGLLEPTNGKLLVDDKKIDKNNLQNWQRYIAHVPQSIFLSDTTISENIAFGIPLEKIDMDRVKRATKRASLDEFIEQLPNKYLTEVGERGVQLSGGQRQRIGIARALYKEAKVIVFDEATSALDNETERNVMESINLLKKDLTILIIAHRLSTLDRCDVIYKLKNGKIYKGNIK